MLCGKFLKNSRSNSGFTLVEMVVVTVIIAILTVITLVTFNGVSQRAIASSLRSDLSGAYKVLKMFRSENGAYPDTIDCGQPDSDTNKCIKASSGTTYHYIVNNDTNPQIFGLTETKNSLSYNVAQNGTVAEGDYSMILLDLDAGDIASYATPSTTWTDLSGQGNNGNLVNGVGYNIANGGALTFDRTNYQFVEVPSYSFQPLIGNAYTISVWIKDDTSAATLDSEGGFHRIISFNDGIKNVQLGLGYEVTTARLFYIQERAAGDGNIEQTTSGGNISAGWHNVVATSDGEGVWDMYLDGNISNGGRPDIGSTPYITNSTHLYIGRRGDGWGYINGYLSDVKIYSGALSDTVIQQNFNNTKGRYGL